MRRILDEGESLSEVISEYPRCQDQLRNDIDTALWLNQKGESLAPRAGFARSTQGYILNQIEKTAGVRQGKKVAFKEPLMVRWVLVALVFVVVYLSGSMLLIDRALPGDRLYEVKTSLEDLRLVLTLDAAEDARLHMRYAQEHLVACAKATSHGRHEDAAMALMNYERHIAGLIRANQILSDDPSTHKDWQNINVSRIYLEDLEIFKVLLAGSS